MKILTRRKVLIFILASVGIFDIFQRIFN